MQAEFGNFDAERHTAHYLKDFQLFPKVRQYINNLLNYTILKNCAYLVFFTLTFNLSINIKA